MQTADWDSLASAITDVSEKRSPSPYLRDEPIALVMPIK